MNEMNGHLPPNLSEVKKKITSSKSFRELARKLEELSPKTRANLFRVCDANKYLFLDLLAALNEFDLELDEELFV